MTLNLYATLTEIKTAMPDGIRMSTVKYDSLLLRLASQVSRFIDRHCRQLFYPVVATRYFNSKGKMKLTIGPLRSPSALLSLTSVEISEDDGLTYIALTVDEDFRLTWWGDFNDPRSWTQLVLDPNGRESAWPDGFRSVKVIGVWAYADDRATAWEDSTDDVGNNPLAAGGTSLTVADADGPDQLGIAPRFQPGQVLRMESEFAYCSAVPGGANTLTIARAQNGTTAAQHVPGTQIDIWRPPEPVKQAAIIQTVRLMERGFQGYGDARANVEMSQMIYLRAWDPEARAKLEPYRIVRAG
jgi:hypothetical protein